MNLAVIAPCVYPSLDRVHYLRDSCVRHGVDIRFHGVGQPYADWRSMLTAYTLPHMRGLETEGFTHVLYVDGIDSVFLSGIEEIAAKYQRLTCGENAVISAESDGTPHGEFWGPRPWKFLNAGGYITPIRLWLNLMEKLEVKYPDEGDYQVWLQKEWPIIGCVLDHDCQIFQVMDGNRAVMPCGSRILNAVTATWPSILHFRGGYCDPVSGRDERIRPWMEALGL